MNINSHRPSATQRFLAPFEKRNRNLMSDFFEFPFDTSSMFREDLDHYFVAPMDISEDKKAFKVVADLPGFDPNKMNIEVEGNSIILSGERENEKREEGKNFFSSERSSGSFYQQLNFPVSADTEKMKCTSKNGVLTLVIPKKANSARKRIKVESLD